MADEIAGRESRSDQDMRVSPERVLDERIKSFACGFSLVGLWWMALEGQFNDVFPRGALGTLAFVSLLLGTSVWLIQKATMDHTFVSVFVSYNPRTRVVLALFWAVFLGAIYFVSH